MPRQSTKRKATLLLSEDAARGLRDAVERGEARSQSEVVEEAVRAFLREARRRWLRAEYEAAVKDPRFMRDVESVTADFAPLDAEAARATRRP